MVGLGRYKRQHFPRFAWNDKFSFSGENLDGVFFLVRPLRFPRRAVVNSPPTVA